MPHEFRNLTNVPSETLGVALIAGGVAAIILLLIMGYFLWRDRKLRKPGSHHKILPSKTRKKRRR